MMIHKTEALPAISNKVNNTAIVSRLAKRSIFRNTRRTLLTVLLISCSLAAILFTDAFVRGMVDHYG